MPNWSFFMPYARSLHIDLVFKQCRIVFATKQRNCAGVILNIQKMIAVWLNQLS